MKVIFKPNEHDQIDIRVVNSIINEACVLKQCYIPTNVVFFAASGENFYSNRYMRPVEIQPFELRHGVFSFNHSGEDMILGTNFLTLVAPFAFFPEGFSYTIHNPMDEKAHLFQIP